MSTNCSPSIDQNYKIVSPDGTIRVTLACSESGPSYALTWRGRELFTPSPLSLFPGAEYKVLSCSASSVNTTWSTVWGQSSKVHDRYEQLILELTASGMRLDLICRIYDDGAGFRFAVPGQGAAPGRAIDFSVAYNTACSVSAYCSNGEYTPLGPASPAELAGEGRPLPILLDAGDDAFIGLLESDLYSSPATEKAAALRISSEQVQSHSTGCVPEEGMVTPWRIILLADQPGRLAISSTPVNMAAECQLSDTSWIKAGKCLWDWRVHGYRTEGFEYGVNTASYERFIRFAAENNIQYVMIDSGWFVAVTDGQLALNPEVDLAHVMKYAKEKNVDILLYYDRKKGDSLKDRDLFKLWSDLDAKGIKYGFMGNDAPFTRFAVEQAARNHLLVNFHDAPCPMTGISRTLPNAITREFCHCQQDRRTAFSPSAFLKMAMINTLSGPIDQCNGAYGLNGINRGERVRGPRKQETYNSTVVSETARALVVFSGLIVLPDAPEEYAKKMDLFEFIRQMPATWDESLVLNSRIGEYITTARRSGAEWFVGSVVNEEGGELRIPLAFLKPGQTYKATFYEDAPESHYVESRETYRIHTAEATVDEVVNARMAPGGGHCMWIRPAAE